MRLREVFWGGVDPYQGIVRPAAPMELEGFQTRCGVIAKAIEERKPRRILEIGCYRGASAIWMAELAPDAEVLTVDPWSLPIFCFQGEARLARYAFAKDYFRQCVLSRHLDRRITYLPMRSDDAFLLIKARMPHVRFDLAYIDGGHSEKQCARDLDNAFEITDGPIIVDDYEPGRFDGIVKAVHAFARKNGMTMTKNNRKAVLKVRKDG